MKPGSKRARSRRAQVRDTSKRATGDASGGGADSAIEALLIADGGGLADMTSLRAYYDQLLAEGFQPTETPETPEEDPAWPAVEAHLLRRARPPRGR